MRINDRKCYGNQKRKSNHPFRFGRFEESEKNNIHEDQYDRMIEINGIGNFPEILKR